MSNCEKCKNAIFSALWGEYKCDVHKRMIFAPEMYEDCEHFAEGSPKESKENAEYEANLEG